MWDRCQKADALHSMTKLEGERYAAFVFGGYLAVLVHIIDNEWEREWMRKHFCYRRVIRADKVKPQMRR